MVAGKRHRVEIAVFNSAISPHKTLNAAKKLVEDHGAKLVLALGGDSFAPAVDYLMSNRVLTASLLPSDLSPDTPSLIAPAEVHPFFNVTGVEWLAKHRPDARRVAMCSQSDSLGLPSLAVYRAGFEVAGHQITKEVQYLPSSLEASAIVEAMLSENPDVLCWCSSAPPMMEALTEAAYHMGFKGEILACTADGYPRMIERTSSEFMERYTFQFPDFDDPKLAETAFFFHQPKAFFDIYNKRFPGEWSAVSWEYASILDIWQNAVEHADSLDQVSVLAAMKRKREMNHVFGPGLWSGETVFGIDNALIGDWPIVRINGGKARIVDFGSVLEWMQKNEAVLIKHLKKLDQMWHQRLAPKSESSLADF